MKKLSKLISFFILVVLIVGSITFKTNALETSNNAQKLITLGLWSSSDLKAVPTRLSTSIMFIRLIGKEKEANQQKNKCPFSDVPASAKNHIGWLYSNNYINGVTATKFGSNDKNAAQIYITYILQELRYSRTKDFSPAKSLDFAEHIGIVTNSQKKKWQNGSFNTSDIADISVQALKAKIKSGESTLIDKLVTNGVIKKDLAIKVGLIASDTDLPKDKEIATDPQDSKTSAEQSIIVVPDKYTADYSSAYDFSSLPKLQIGADSQTFLIPAMPKYGFNFPYLIRIPSNHYQRQNSNAKQYLVVQVYNTPTLDSNLDGAIKNAKSEITYDIGSIVSEKLCVPEIKPIIPRLSSYSQAFHNLALPRALMTLPLTKQTDPDLYARITSDYNYYGWNLEDFLYPDFQVKNMINHALAYINSNGFHMENKVFLTGFSASGDFSERFTPMHTDIVRAEASGFGNADKTLPISQLNGENLIYPIGTYDFKQITGKDYSIPDMNKIAHLYFDGSEDPLNDFYSKDLFSDQEQKIIGKLLGTSLSDRIQNIQNYLFQTDEQDEFISDQGQGHSYSNDMIQFIVDFFKANRGDTVTYLIPNNQEQLKYHIWPVVNTKVQPAPPPTFKHVAIFGPKDPDECFARTFQMGEFLASENNFNISDINKYDLIVESYELGTNLSSDFRNLFPDITRTDLKPGEVFTYKDNGQTRVLIVGSNSDNLVSIIQTLTDSIFQK